jgi:hypothetical protein
MNAITSLGRALSSLSLVALALVCFVLPTQALRPPPKGGHSGGSTADGQDKLAVAARTLSVIIGAKVLPRDVRVIDPGRSSAGRLSLILQEPA